MKISLGLPLPGAGARASGASGSRATPLVPGPLAGLGDKYGRRATDMRLSLTDKCNLRCTYCMPADGLDWLTKEHVMTGKEIVRLVRIGVEQLGIRELRLTGGEPLVRADLVDIIRAIRTSHADLPISLTTNALGLEKKAQALKDAGLTRINVSLDSLHPDTFAQLTRRPLLKRVVAGVEEADRVGLGLIKINAVLMRGVNDHEAPQLLDWALSRGFELRFIEQMPLDADHGWTRKGVISAAEIRELLEPDFVLAPDPRQREGAPPNDGKYDGGERAARRAPGSQAR